MTEKRLAHAIVLGGSAAGLLAGRVLAHHAQRVTLVERDDLPDAAQHRKGTPQSRHANNLQPRALPLLEAWFPGLSDEFERAGAVPVADETRVVIRGVRYAHTQGAPTTFLLTRPLLDAILRRRLRALGNVSFATQCDVTGVRLDPAGNVTGALLQSERGHVSLAGELVVDAMGRGTRGRHWLSEFGYAEPSITELRVNVHYASRLFSRVATDLQGDKLAVISPTADVPRGAVAVAVEENRWLVTLFEYAGGTPPTEISEFRAFARTLVAGDVGELVARAAAVDDGAGFAFPSACLRHFDKLRALPDGYLCLGDSLCQLNPCYGQGITSAVLQAEALTKALERGRHSLPRRYYKLAAKAVSQPFNLSWAADVDLPGVVAPPSPTPPPIRTYLRRAIRVARYDPIVALALRRIMGLVDPSAALLRPSVALRVLFGNAQEAPKGARGATPISVA